jgi:DNA-binding transcriptional MerR regulator
MHTGTEVKKLTGMTYRRLNYLDKTGVIEPERSGARKDRRYSIDDVVYLLIMKALKEKGLSLQQIRPMINEIIEFFKSRGETEGWKILVDNQQRIYYYTGDLFGHNVLGTVFDISLMRVYIEKNTRLRVIK